MNRLIDKKVGVYLKKENEREDFLDCVSRLSWLTYEYQNKNIFTKLYIDEYLHTHKFNKLMEDIKEKKIEAVLIWSSDDITGSNLSDLVIRCFISQIPIISFCEGEIGINQAMKIENERFIKKYSEYFVRTEVYLKEQEEVI